MWRRARIAGLVAIGLCEGAFADANRVAELVERLQRGTVKAKIQAAHALGRLRDRRAVPALVTALSDAEEALRAAAAESLGLLGGPVAVAALERARDDRSAWVRREVARSLERLKRPRRPVVLDVDETYAVDDGRRPDHPATHCRRALSMLPRNPEAARRWLYELAWKIPDAERREQAAEIVARIDVPDGGVPVEAAGCCEKAGKEAGPLRALFDCLSSTLPRKAPPAGDEPEKE